VDFGNFKMAKVFGVKFEDKNGNQVRDPGEGPLSGVTINLMDAKTATIFASTVTDLSGNYAFTNLFVGKFGKNDTGFYRVREVVPTGYKQTTINPPDFQIVSGTNVGPLDFGNQLLGGGGGGGGPGAGTIIVAGSGEGVTGTVRVFNASKLTQMFSFVPYGTTFRGGVRVAKGDVNGDGQADIITAPGAGTTLATAGISPLIKIFDGATGKLVRQFLAYDAGFKGGVYVGSGDVNGDGVSDIITGAGKTAPHVKVFDGKTGAELFSFMAIGNNFSGGVRVAMGDVNGDGFADLITAPGKGMAPVVRVWDGSNFGVGPPTLMREFTAFESSFTGGLFVGTGNVNGDAFADIIVGPDAGRRADVKVYDGATNKLLTTFTAAGDPTRPSMIFSDPAWNAGVRVTNADLNGDGLDDIVCGPGILRNPHIRGYSGKTGQKLIDFAPFPSTFLGGVFVG
jgi:SdrD B-like protein/VCBS repeat protein